jgi:hypothetical protein
MPRPHRQSAGDNNVYFSATKPDQCIRCTDMGKVQVHQLSESCKTCSLAIQAFGINPGLVEGRKYKWCTPYRMSVDGRLGAGVVDDYIDGGREHREYIQLWNLVRAENDLVVELLDFELISGK